MPKIVDHDARRREIAEATARLIAKNGLDNTTIQGIAEACNCTPGMLLHYYDNKDSLLVSALTWCERQYQSRINQAVGNFSGLDAVYERLKAALPIDEDTQVEWSISLQFWSRIPFNPIISKVYNNYTWHAFNSTVEDLRVAVKDGQLRADLDAEWVAKMLVSHVTGLGVSALYNAKNYPPETQERMLREAIEELRAPEKDAVRRSPRDALG